MVVCYYAAKNHAAVHPLRFAAAAAEPLIGWFAHWFAILLLVTPPPP